MKFSLLALFIFAIVLIVPDSAAAQSPFVACNGPDCSFCNFVDIANTSINWLIGIVFLIFAILLVVTGFGLLTSGGNSGAKADAKNKITNAFIGIVIILIAWIGVDTLMKALLDGNNDGTADGEITGWGPWSNVQCQTQSPTTASSGPGPGPSPTTGTPSCASTCVDLTGVPTKGAATCEISLSPTGNCQIESTFLPQVRAFHTAVVAAGVSNMRVTEAHPPTGWTASDPTGIHASGCHAVGNCIDYNTSAGGLMSPADVIAVINAGNASGVRAVYEVSSASDRSAYISAGVPPDRVQLVPAITAPHFSVYD